MAPKYTILKVLIHNSSKVDNSKQGFTLIELIVGLLMMVIVSSLALNAFVNASTSFNKDKKNIESNQNLTAVLEIIGNDIRQSGENISDSNFPTIEFQIASAAETSLMSGSSKIIVRRALLSSLTLCESIAVNQSITAGTKLAVADNLKATVNSSVNCDVGTSSSPLSVYRVSTVVTNPAPPTTTPPTVTSIETYYPPSSTLNPYPVAPAPLALKLPLALRKVRDYRCNTNPNIVYDSATNVGTDFCDPAATNTKKLRIAVSNQKGQVLIFNQTDEVAATTSDTVINEDATNTTTSAKKYQITLGQTSPAIPLVTGNTVATGDAVAKNTTNIAVPYTVTTPATTIAYPIGSPIYVIEERVYTLTSDNKLQLSINGESPETLVKKIDNFRVSARTYTNSKDRIVQPTPTANVCTDGAPFAAQPTSPGVDTPKYVCQFNYFTGTGTVEWKTLAGIKVEIQAKYDSSGGSATPSTQDTNKSYAAAEYFPRNVLSK
jgi:prepilin-type N-terminal cleavage/methylation domain-containing protein